MGSVPASALVLTLVSHSGLEGDGNTRFISSGLGVALIFAAIAVIFRSRLTQYAVTHLTGLTSRGTAMLTAAAGAVVGILVSVTSVGAGALGVIALLALYPRLSMRTVIGSDVAHAVPLTLVAGMGHWMMGTVDLPILGSLLVGSLPGIIAGSQIAIRMPEYLLKNTLAVVLAVIGLKLLL
jgi:hypothetical protein